MKVRRFTRAAHLSAITALTMSGLLVTFAPSTVGAATITTVPTRLYMAPAGVSIPNGIAQLVGVKVGTLEFDGSTDPISQDVHSIVVNTVNRRQLTRALYGPLSRTSETTVFRCSTSATHRRIEVPMIGLGLDSFDINTGDLDEIDISFVDASTQYINEAGRPSTWKHNCASRRLSTPSSQFSGRSIRRTATPKSLALQQPKSTFRERTTTP